MSINRTGLITIAVIFVYFVAPKSFVFDYVGVHKEIGDSLLPWVVQRYLILLLLFLYLIFEAVKREVSIPSMAFFFY